MNDTRLPTLSCSDRSLCEKLAALAAEERNLAVDFLTALADFDERRVYALLGYSSVFAYLTEELRLSDGSAYRRLTAARLLRRMPEIGPFLRDGRVSLAKLSTLKEVLTPENLLEILGRAAALPERAVQGLAVELDPSKTAAPRRDSIRAIGRSASPPAQQFTSNVGSTGMPTLAGERSFFEESDARPVGPPETRAPSPERASPTACEPVTVLHSVRMTVGPEFMALLGELKSALSHTYPDGRLEDLLAHAMKVAIVDHEKKSRAKVERPRGEAVATHGDDLPPNPKGRSIPAAVRREVWRRDGGACTFVGAGGKRCGSKHFLEVHHLFAFAHGGPTTVENLTQRCRAHNQLEATLDFGTSRTNSNSRARRATGFPGPGANQA